jgi:glucose-1-phosphate thymidylyltransferase
MSAAGVEQTAVLTPPSMLDEVRACLQSDCPAGAEVSYLPHDSTAEPRAALRAIAGFAEDSPTILHRAEGLLGQPLAPLLHLLAEKPDAVLLVIQGARYSEPLRSAAQQALRLVEIDPAKAPIGLAGVCMLSGGLLSELCAAGAWPPSLHLSQLVEAIVAHSAVERPQVRIVSHWRPFTGNPLDLLDINRTILDGLKADGAGGTPQAGNTFEGSVFIDPSATVTSSVISGPVVVGAGAQIANSYIGPHTSIGEETCIEGAEIERSIVFAGASILHIGGRLVASVVGRDARIFRDFSIPRAMRMHVGDGDEVALC